jgi:SAM-dependent methyltransferase
MAGRRVDVVAAGDQYSVGMSAPGTIAPSNPGAPLRERSDFVRSDDGYDVRYLLAFEHAAFVDCAYLAILERPSDPQGQANAMKFLQAGGDKLLLLGGLRYSPEGRARRVHIRGLRSRYLLRRAYGVPIIGYLLECVALTATLPRVARRVRADRFRASERLDGLTVEPDHRSSALQRALDDAASARVLLERTVEAQEAATRERCNSFEAAMQTLGARSGSIESALGALREQFEMSMLGGHVTPELERFYLQFEEKFRGTREEIKTRVAVYLPKLAEAGVGGVDRPVLDLGCGRGDWLEVLREQGLASRGVDLNKVRLDELRTRGLDVVEADFVEYLRNAADASVGAITGMHIVEHLPFPVLVELVDHARRVLKPGGLLILETPNPRNVLVASHTFHLDPTHRSPIPSALLMFLLEARGFTSIDVCELHPSEHEWSAIESEFDRYLVANLFGPQDYAVIARTPDEV